MAVSEQRIQSIEPDPSFLEAVQLASSQEVSTCYRCLQCSAGCPMAEVMDYPPDRLIRMIQLGLKEEALQSNAIWLCSACLTCSERCPNGIDVARVLDSLKEMALAEKRRPGEPRIADFHHSFLAVVKQYGRMHEASLIVLLKMKSRDWFSDLGAGIGLFFKGKIPPIPQRVQRRSEISGVFRASEGSDGRIADREGTP